VTGWRARWVTLAVLVAATGLLITTVAWVARGSWSGPSMMGASISGTGPVRTLDDAHRAATRFADGWGLTVGEVMQFDNGFYAELVDPDGDLATEVLVDPGSGGVQVEFGPAMMWNTAYGMHPARATTQTVDGDQAQAIADRWLRASRSGEHAGTAEAFPGYYTLHVLRGDQIVGMLSVNATTGAVWYHSWHGRFIAAQADAD
jgi:hypothetical protein